MTGYKQDETIPNNEPTLNNTDLDLNIRTRRDIITKWWKGRTDDTDLNNKQDETPVGHRGHHLYSLILQTGWHCPPFFFF